MKNLPAALEPAGKTVQVRCRCCKHVWKVDASLLNSEGLDAWPDVVSALMCPRCFSAGDVLKD